MNLTKFAKDKPCLIRVPGRCNGRPETTVLCHVRLIGISGGALKSPDLLAAFGCNDCHDIVDGRTGSWIQFPREARDLMLLEGVMRTQAYLIEHNLIKW